MNLPINLHEEIQSLTPSMIAMRRDFHRHPEIGFKEFRTAGILADHLEALGLEVSRGVGKTGVVAELRGALAGKTVMLRADIDALPILETTGAEYASITPGAMHACGHDGHASIAAHVASVFAKHKPNLTGHFRFVFQPAEEIVNGATAMLEDKPNLLEGVDAVVGLHLWNDMPVGWVGVRPGPVMAAPDSFTIFVGGSGGHAAVPHRAVDPVVIAAHLITALQTLVSRETDPNLTGVISITTVIAGQGAHNIIPEVAELRGTLSAGLSSALGGRARVEWLSAPPPVVNDAALTEHFRQVSSQIAEVQLAEPTMGGDDMSEFLSRRPGVYFFVGSNDASTGRDKPHHHPGFDFDDERALPLAAELLANAALEFARI
jgi:amidohydrolase